MIDREVLTFMPPISQAMDDFLAWLSLCILLVTVCVGSDGQQPDEEQGMLEMLQEEDDRYGTLENPRIPLEEVSCRARLDAVANRARQSVGHTERLSKYLAMAGEFFAVVIEGMQFQRDIVTQVSLYHLELCTRCFASGCLQPWQEVLELSASKETYALLRGVDELKRMFPDCLQRDMISHGQYLYGVHGGYIATRGYDMVKIKDALNIQDPEPEMEDDIEVGTPIAGSDDEWAQGPASTSTSGSGFTVENDEDRRIRYTCFPLQECSDPEYWFRVNHFADSASDSQDMSINSDDA